MCASVMVMFILLVLNVWVPATQAQVAGDLRLVSSFSTSSSGGRLEIFLRGEWGTVCDDNFGSTDALVACRQLGYSTVQQESDVGTLGYSQASSSVSIWLDDVACNSSSVRALIFCGNRGIGSHNCGHSEDQALVCSGFFSPTPPSSGTLRLVNDTSPAAVAGRVEIYWQGEWGTVCTDLFGLTEANVVCRQLGLGSAAIREGSVGALGYPSASSSVRTWLDSVDCFSFDSRLQFCNHNDFGMEDCTHSQDQAVVCRDVITPTTTTPVSGDLRLVSSSFSTSGNSRGRLEIYLLGEWGTVCDDDFGQREADVACGQLGFASASNYGSVGSLGFSQASSSTETWLDNVNCDSFDTRLDQCRHNGIGVENCGHFEDIALICSSSTTSSGGSTAGGIIAGVVIAIVVVFVGIPLCITCIYIGNSKRRMTRARAAGVVGRTSYPAQPAPAVVTTTTTTATERVAAYPVQPQQAPPPHPSAYEPQKALPDSTLQQAPPPPYAQAVAYPPASYPAQPYPQQGAPYPQQGAPYPQQGAPYPQQGAPYPQQGAPYPQQGAPYPQQGAPYPQQGAAGAAYPPGVQSSGYAAPYPVQGAAAGPYPDPDAAGDAPSAPPPS